MKAIIKASVLGSLFGIFLGLFLVDVFSEESGPYKKPGLEAAQLVVLNEDKRLPPIFRFQGPNSLCTATVVYENYAVTAAHCVEPKIKYTVTGEEITVEAAFIDEELDRAILVGNFKDHAAQVMDHHQDILHIAQAVIYCGYPSGSLQYVCKQAQRMRFDYFKVVFSNTALPGMSGGPTVDKLSGELVGIVVGVYRDGATGATSTVGLFDLAEIKIPD